MSATDSTLEMATATGSVAALTRVSRAPPSSVNVTRTLTVLPASAGTGV